MLLTHIKKLCMFAIATTIMVTGCQLKSSDQSTISDTVIEQETLAKGLLSLSLPEIIAALDNRSITSEQLVNSYLKRINALDQKGPKLRAIISINPEALSIARSLDRLRAKGQIKGRLHGIPVLLKDNIETKDKMPTTAGAIALRENYTGRDSPLAAGLRAQGAIILGKTNLSQWANFRSESSMSGWSALAGQVRNPHMLDRNPCGSSSGSGAATAASLAAASVGTETNGSIICPSNANGIVGFKPSVGVIPQDHIIPISHSQDTAGPMTKSVTGAAIMMNAMASDSLQTDFVASLNKDSLKGVRVGVLRFAQAKTPAIIELFNQALTDLETAGAILVNIDNGPKLADGYWSKSYDLLKYEFKHGLNQYLASTKPELVKVRSLQQLIEFNQKHAATELALFDQSILIASQTLGTLEDKAYQEALKIVPNASKKAIDELLNEHQVSVLVSPSGPIIPRIDPINGDVWPNDWPGVGSYAARAGYPHVSVPMGAAMHLPLGLSFIGSHNQDGKILSYAYAYEKVSNRRLTPNYFPNAEAVPMINSAMSGVKE
jgi:amidase